MTRKRRFKNEKYDSKIEVPHNFYAVTEGNAITLNIFGEIGESWWGESTSAADINAALNGVEVNEITVNISSPGGSAFDGIAIYNILKDHSAKVKIIVPGWACSAASVIAMAADELTIGVGAMLMIHPASVGIWGNKDDLEKEAQVLKKLDESILDIYMKKFKGTREELKVLVDNETWFTASEAVEIGFADAVTEIEDVEDVPENKLDAEQFKNSILARFRKAPAAQAPGAPVNILNQFKRNSNE